MTGPLIAWFVLGASGLGLAWLVCLATRRWGQWRYLAACLILACTLTPYRFDAEHEAPAFAVAVFRLFLEDGLDPQPPLLAIGAVTLGVVAVYLAVLGVRAVVGRRGRRP